jgi:hypothetical protein
MRLTLLATPSPSARFDTLGCSKWPLSSPKTSPTPHPVHLSPPHHLPQSLPGWLPKGIPKRKRK